MVDKSTGSLPGHLIGFVHALRARNIGIGQSETINAGHALTKISWDNREDFREALACTLLHKPSHRTPFDDLFDLWFPLGVGGNFAHFPDDGHVEIPTDDAGELDPQALADLISDLLLDGSPDAIEKARQLASMLVDEFGKYDSFAGEAFSAFQTLSHVDTDTVAQKLLDGLLGANPADPDGAARNAEKIAARRQANSMLRDFMQQVADETKRRTAETVGRDEIAKYAVHDAAEHIDFLRAQDKDLHEFRRRVGPLARQLGSRLAARRKRSRAGAIDIRKTMRASMSTGGVPIHLELKKPRPARPELVILCDISGSVAGFSHFTLQLVHALREQFSRVRIFAFIDNTDEVTRFFESGTDLASAMSRMVSEAELVTYDGHSDYGHSIAGFADRYADSLSRNGALLILGDGRNNYRDPRVESLEFITERVNHVHWLNPEPENQWGTGDSIAPLYSQYVSMHECRTIDQLTTVISSLLPV